MYVGPRYIMWPLSSGDNLALFGYLLDGVPLVFGTLGFAKFDPVCASVAVGDMAVSPVQAPWWQQEWKLQTYAIGDMARSHWRSGAVIGYGLCA